MSDPTPARLRELAKSTLTVRPIPMPPTIAAALRAGADAMERELKWMEYADHKSDCDVHSGRSGLKVAHCDCGLSALRKEASDG